MMPLDSKILSLYVARICKSVIESVFFVKIISYHDVDIMINESVLMSQYATYCILQ